MRDPILVTGGNGFLAGWCIGELLRRGRQVRASVRDAAAEAALRGLVAARQAGPRLEVVHADLDADAGWEAAMTGCHQVLHLAAARDGSRHRAGTCSLLATARGGTVRVLQAALQAGVRRVVMTSSAVAAHPGCRHHPSVSDERVWADPADPGLNPFRRAKVLAERQAWSLLGPGSGRATSLTTVLPGTIAGPLLPGQRPQGLAGLLLEQLQGRVPGIYNVGFNIVDVRDLATLLVDALDCPAAAGQRFLATGEFLWMDEIVRILRRRLGEQAARVHGRCSPDWLVRLLGLVSPGVRALVPLLGQRHEFHHDKARRLLGFRPRPASDTVIDCAQSLLPRLAR